MHWCLVHVSVHWCLRQESFHLGTNKPRLLTHRVLSAAAAAAAVAMDTRALSVPAIGGQTQWRVKMGGWKLEMVSSL